MRPTPFVLAVLFAAFASPALGAGQISLVTPLALSPPSPAVNQATTGTFTVKNTGTSAVTVQTFLIGARNPANGNVDFPGSAAVTLQPGQSYTYSGSRSFATTRTYTGWPAYIDGASWIELAPAHTSFTVQQLALTTALALSPSAPVVNQTTTATFTATNVGGSAISVPSFLVGARTPANANVDFPESAAVTLQPGQSFTYSGSRSFTVTGTHTAWPAYFDGAHWIELAAPTSFAVQQTSPGKITLTSALALNPASPSVNQSTTATYSVQNTGGSAITVSSFLVGARNPSNGNVDFPTTSSVTLQPGQTYNYSGSRSFTTAGTYTAWPAYFDGSSWIELASPANFSVAGSGGSGSGLFPATSPWYQDISSATTDPESGQVISGLTSLGWGTGSMQIDFSIQVLRADPSLAARTFTRGPDFFDPDCDFVPIPVPPGGRLEGESNYACTGDGDCHLIVLQGSKLFEMWRANISGGTSTGSPFVGGCLAVWDTTRDYWQPNPNGFARGDQCTSADAAGYPITPLLFNADEVQAGAINHAIRFILPNDRIRKGQYVHPATHSGAGQGTPVSNLVPYGARLRLKSTFNLQSLPNEAARVVARAMQRYGMFLADGGNITLTAQADTFTTAKWSGLLGARDLAAIKPSDFDMVAGGTRIPLTLDCTRTP
jgi:hypothetical protein